VAANKVQAFTAQASGFQQVSSLSCHNLSALDVTPSFGCRHSGKLLCATVSSVPLMNSASFYSIQAVVKVLK